MPNWCSNKIKIIGKPEKIVKFLNQIKEKCEDGSEKALSFYKIMPEPQTKEECPEQYIIETSEDKEKAGIQEAEGRPWFNWYEWHNNEWGCKWDCIEVSEVPSAEDIVKNQMTEINIYYETPWGPAIGIMKHLLSQEEIYDLQFEFMYFEPGMGFMGEMSNQGEYEEEYVEVEDEETGEYHGDEKTQAFIDEFYEQ